jgi:hypothetical protein
MIALAAMLAAPLIIDALSSLTPALSLPAGASLNSIAKRHIVSVPTGQTRTLQADAADPNRSPGHAIVLDPNSSDALLSYVVCHPAGSELYRQR